MRLAGSEDTDIRLDINGQPCTGPNGDFALAEGDDCWMQDIWIESQTEEGELLWEDEEGQDAYGFGLTAYAHAECSAELEGEITELVIEKLSKRDYIDDGSIEASFKDAGAGGWAVNVCFSKSDGTGYDLDIISDGSGVAVY